MKKVKKTSKKNSNTSHNKEKIGKKENRQLRNILLGIGGFVVLTLLFILLMSASKNFKYEGVNFKIVHEGDLTFYNTKVPLYSQGEYYDDYNFYLRNDPRKLDVDFDGTLTFRQEMVVDAEDSFYCGGYGAIAIENLRRLYELYGRRMIKNESLNCDLTGSYTYLNFKPGNKTKIVQVGPTCYDIIIKDCEILQGAEKFMIETFVKINKQQLDKQQL